MKGKSSNAGSLANAFSKAPAKCGFALGDIDHFPASPTPAATPATAKQSAPPKAKAPVVAASETKPAVAAAATKKPSARLRRSQINDDEETAESEEVVRPIKTEVTHAEEAPPSSNSVSRVSGATLNHSNRHRLEASPSAD